MSKFMNLSSETFRLIGTSADGRATTLWADVPTNAEAERIANCLRKLHDYDRIDVVASRVEVDEFSSGR